MQRLLLALLLTPLFVTAQKRPLNASDYDRWQSVRAEKISNDGRWTAYQIDLQEGDGRLEVTPAGQAAPKYTFARGYMAQFTPDNQFLVMRLKAPYADTRKAKLKKKKADELPRDSMVVLNLSTGKTTKLPNVKSFTLSKDAGNWVAVLQERKDEKSGRESASARPTPRRDTKDTLNPLPPV